MEKTIKIIVSGGGTAGHIYPAISIVKEIEKMVGESGCEVLFVGANGKIEEQIVPREGYAIKTLPIQGISRKSIIYNIKTIYKLIKSLFIAKKIVKEFKPDIIIGFGGYASYPVIMAGRSAGAKLYIWEGNSFAGLANKLVCKYVRYAFVSFNNMERFFGNKTRLCGNPIRSTFASIEKKSEDALNYFGFRKDQKVLFITGGSLGAQHINEVIIENIDALTAREDIAVIWQTGKHYYDRIEAMFKDREMKNIWIAPFINNMGYAYSIADVIACRSGASTVAEVAQCGVATIFIPSPNVTEDHQTKNAKSLVDADAAVMITDKELAEKFINEAIALLDDEDRRNTLSKNIKTFARPDSAHLIASTILEE